MKRPALDSDMELFRDSARKFFQTEIRPHSERWREAGIVDREAFLKAGGEVQQIPRGVSGQVYGSSRQITIGKK